MNPQIDFQKDQNDGILRFRLKNVNVSFANAIRRTALSNIPLIVMKTFPHEESMCNIFSNTTHLSDNIIKQRLKCIPIHHNASTYFNLNNYGDYELVLQHENKEAFEITLTTEYFQLRNKQTNEFLPASEVHKIFPSDKITNDYIDLVRMKPIISNVPGDNIHLTCDFTVDCAFSDGGYNAVSNCSYGCTVDEVKQSEILVRKIEEWTAENKNIDLETQDWLMLDGMRIIVPNSFDFIVETVGQYTNIDIIRQCCNVLIRQLQQINQQITEKKIKINVSSTTLKNAFEIELPNEDHTIGKVFEFMFLQKYFEATPNILTFCVMDKAHPHNNFITIKLAYNMEVDNSVVNGHLQTCSLEAIALFETIKSNLR